MLVCVYVMHAWNAYVHARVWLLYFSLSSRICFIFIFCSSLYFSLFVCFSYFLAFLTCIILFYRKMCVRAFQVSNVRILNFEFHFFSDFFVLAFFSLFVEEQSVFVQIVVGFFFFRRNVRGSTVDRVVLL